MLVARRFLASFRRSNLGLKLSWRVEYCRPVAIHLMPHRALGRSVAAFGRAGTPMPGRVVRDLLK